MQYRTFILPLAFFIITGCKIHTSNAMGKDVSYFSKHIGNTTVKNVADTAVFNARSIYLANNDTLHLWPAPMPYPLAGAVLPYNRIVAFYGNIYDKEMGILGEFPKKELLSKLKSETGKWASADPITPVIPAFHCIAVEKWDEPNTDGKLRDRISSAQIDTLLRWAKPLDGLVFLDLQVGNSTLQEELPLLEKYLVMNNVHLGIDPEFSIKEEATPPGPIGSFNSDDVNYTIAYLATLVRKYHLPPKILIIHRFTENMVKGYASIKKIPEVQIVMDMDGFGNKSAKETSYYNYIFKQPVEFTGFKLFYKYDRRNNGSMMTPKEILALTPRPVYIQYE